MAVSCLVASGTVSRRMHSQGVVCLSATGELLQRTGSDKQGSLSSSSQWRGGEGLRARSAAGSDMSFEALNHNSLRSILGLQEHPAAMRHQQYSLEADPHCSYLWVGLRQALR